MRIAGKVSKYSDAFKLYRVTVQTIETLKISCQLRLRMYSRIDECRRKNYLSCVLRFKKAFYLCIVFMLI